MNVFTTLPNSDDSGVFNFSVAPAPGTIRHADLVESVAAALQYISYYHPADYIAHLARAYEAEQSPAAKDAIAQILTNSRFARTPASSMCF